jgi:TetR/AcrR family transcriptional regulator, cholesterol catabolism regulator
VAEEHAQGRAPSALPPSRAERRSRIVRTALEMLSESDYEDIQMRDVAEGSDVALATLYRYFPSKERLFAAVQLEWVELLHRRVAQGGLQGDSDLERLLDVLRRSVRSFKTSPQFYRVLMMLESTKDPVARELYEKMAQVTADTYRVAIRNTDQETAEHLLRATLDILGAEMRAWAIERRSIEEAARRIEESLHVLFTYREQKIRRTTDLHVAPVARTERVQVVIDAPTR